MAFATDYELSKVVYDPYHESLGSQALWPVLFPYRLKVHISKQKSRP